jgi:hypothetical protein
MTEFTPAALRWLEAILQERFGQPFELVQHKKVLTLSFSGSKKAIIFDQLQQVFRQSRSDFPCKYWDASIEGFKSPIEGRIPAPSEMELPKPLILENELGATIHYDILGLAYWMLLRMEEIGRTDLDEHQRFPARASHAYKNDYLERPIVDEWLIILGQVIKRVWPEIQLSQHKFRVKVSHDVDRPSRYGFRSTKALIRAMAGDVLKYHNLRGALIAPWVRLATRQRLHPADPFNTFDWLMDVSEKNGLTSAFFFICGRTDPSKDADYEPDHPAIRHLMRRIRQRGHEIGLHPSFNTFQSPELLKKEADRLRRICTEEGIEQSEWGGRMHYLRWEHPTTLRAWAAAGMTYDSTLGYADMPGFRCGTCHEYAAFDPLVQEPLGLRLRPLVVMEGTVFSSKYLGLDTEEAEAKFLKLKDRCRAVGGWYTVLWHNSEFVMHGMQNLYSRILSDPLC